MRSKNVLVCPETKCKGLLPRRHEVRVMGLVADSGVDIEKHLPSLAWKSLIFGRIPYLGVFYRRAVPYTNVRQNVTRIKTDTGASCESMTASCQSSWRFTDKPCLITNARMWSSIKADAGAG